MTETKIVGDPEMLARLRTWVEPLIGEVSDHSLRDLQDILEDGAALSGLVPQYRRIDA